MSVVSAGWSGGGSSGAGDGAAVAEASGAVDRLADDVFGVGNGRGTAPDEAHAAVSRLAASVTHATDRAGVSCRPSGLPAKRT